MIETPEAEVPKTKTLNTFTFQWIFVCAVGYAIGMPMGSWAGGHGYSIWDSFVNTIGMNESVKQYNYVFASGLMGATLGGIMSLCQWFVLRKYIQNATWWILIGLFGYFFGIALNSVFPERFSFNYFVTTIFTALVIGRFESLLLQKSLPASGWITTRILINSITLIVANINAEAQSVFNLSGPEIYIGNSLMGLTSGLISGVISGFKLNSFINRAHELLQDNL